MDKTTVIMKLLGTLSRLDLLSVDFQGFLLLKMGARWYVEKAEQETSTLTP